MVGPLGPFGRCCFLPSRGEGGAGLDGAAFLAFFGVVLVSRPGFCCFLFHPYGAALLALLVLGGPAFSLLLSPFWVVLPSFASFGWCCRSLFVDVMKLRLIQ